MRSTLLSLAGLIGACLGLTVWLLAPAPSVRYTAVGLAVASIALVVGAIRWPKVQLIPGLVALIGVALLVLGLSGAPSGGAAVRAAEGIAGLFLTVLGLLASQVSRPASVAVVDKDGRTLAEVMSIRRRGDVLAMKANLLNTMPSTIYLTPDELWKAIGLMDASVVLALPRMLMLGWWRSRRSDRKDSASPTGTSTPAAAPLAWPTPSTRPLRTTKP
jgi:hypothetical protein